MVLTLGALLAMAGISAGASLISSAANQAHAVAAREDTQDFNAQEAEIQRQWSSKEAQTARAFSADEAQKQRDFEKMMSDTSYQRQRADLEAAGYNPASIGMTSGAVTPSGASASPTVATAQAASAGQGFVPQMSSYFSNLLSNAIQVRMAQDRNFTNKTIAEMYAQNSRQMNELTNATRKAMKNYSRVWRQFTKEDGGTYGFENVSPSKV